MFTFLTEYRRRRARRLFAEHAAAFDTAASRLPFPELVALFMAHVEFRDDADPERVRMLEFGLGQHADRMERTSRGRAA